MRLFMILSLFILSWGVSIPPVHADACTPFVECSEVGGVETVWGYIVEIDPTDGNYLVIVSTDASEYEIVYAKAKKDIVPDNALGKDVQFKGQLVSRTQWKTQIDLLEVFEPQKKEEQKAP